MVVDPSARFSNVCFSPFSFVLICFLIFHCGFSDDRDSDLGLAGELGLVIGDGLDLGGGGALGVKAVGHPFVGELLRKLDADDTLAHAEDLSIVGEDRALHGEGVVGRDGADAGNLVGGDGHTQSGTADEESTVSLALGDELRTGDGRVRVGSLVGGRVDTDVLDRLHEGVLLQDGLDGLLVGLAGFVAGHDDAEGLDVGHCGK